MIQERYPFTPGFEAALVTLLASRPRLFGRLGREVEPEAFGSRAAVLAAQAAQAVAQDTGNGSESLLITLQRVRRWMHEGKVTVEDLESVSDLFDGAEDAGLPDEEQAVAEAAPILRRRLHAQATRTAMEQYGHQGDMGKVIDLVERAGRLGRTDTSVGLRFGEAAFGAISQVRQMARLATGVPELDLALDGGLQSGGLGIIMGGPGGGKSIFLGHCAARAVLRGLRVGYATLELDEATVSARLMANLTGVPTSEIMAGHHDVARACLEELGLTGSCLIKAFPPHGTALADLRQWIQECSQQDGAPFDLVAVDYLDKLSNPSVNGREVSNYEAGRINAEGMRLLAYDLKRYFWTASQTRRKDGKPSDLLDIQDAADSFHKPRVADLVITLNPRDDGTQMLYYVAKHRTGRSGVRVGPVPTDFECGRIATVAVQGAW